MTLALLTYWCYSNFNKYSRKSPQSENSIELLDRHIIGMNNDLLLMLASVVSQVSTIRDSPLHYYLT